MNRIQSLPMLMLALGTGLGRAQPPPAPETQVITGRPFTADATTVRTQTLVDGNRVIHTITSFLARDTEGRTRLEETIELAGSTSASRDSKKVIFIRDPVANMNYVLNPSHKARRIAIAPPSGISGPSEAQRLLAPNSKVESLGMDVIEGFRVEGARTTEVIPAEAIGNDRQIEIISERWYSAELQTIVMSKRHDPRTGETLYQLTHIQRVEPPAFMFEVPPDYSVEDLRTPMP